jgi:hypothetical protein
MRPERCHVRVPMGWSDTWGCLSRSGAPSWAISGEIIRCSSSTNPQGE